MRQHAAVTTYGLLGSLEVRRDGRLVDVGGGKQVALLALLLLDAGRAVSLDRIVDALWGDDPPPSAGPSVHAYVSKLRRALRVDATTPAPLGRRGPGYAIEVPVGALDLHRFRVGCEEVRGLVEAARWSEAADRAAETAALWRGPLLAELADEEWVRVAARPWEERRLHLEHDRVTALLGCDRELEAAAAGARLAEAYPLDERACALHVIALHRAGRTAEALQVWQAFVAFLDE
jgi:DNA-binding SARP family transcriptional activator